ncbi:MAG TPA: DUF5674 family protein [Patescibacteria group bacterium]
MPIKIVTDKITKDELQIFAKERFGDMVKVVVDLSQKIMAVGGQMHADEEALLLQQGSKQEDLWGINLYPDLEGDNFIEFDSMINLRPAQGNKTRGIEDSNVREKITKIVYELYSR